jgi:AAA15 family ATPase/GTPase
LPKKQAKPTPNMLIEFTVKNYRSIREAQTLSMAKAKGSELEESNTFAPDSPGSIPLLRSLVIYGANAAGKTNLLRAFEDMEIIVRTSASSRQEGDDILVTPFLFDKNSQDEPTEFEAVFINNGIKYQYGFAVKRTHVVEEWLIAYPKGRPQRWFERAFNDESKESEYKFGEYLFGQKSVWKNATRNNALFLSTAVQLNSEQLKPVFSWFKDKVRPTSMERSTTSFTASMCFDDDIEKVKVIDFLKVADFDIQDLHFDQVEFDPKFLSDEIPDVIKDEMVKNLGERKFLDIKTIHETEDGELVYLNMTEESNGTNKIFSFAGPWIHSLRRGYILIIDELHDSLHPKLVRHLVKLFNNSKTNPSNAQLIFTTHETSILDQDLFRRDQIWFCEKDENKSTSLYPLTDFMPRKGRENLELSYLSGRYGALPFVDQTLFQ